MYMHCNSYVILFHDDVSYVLVLVDQLVIGRDIDDRQGGLYLRQGLMLQGEKMH